MDINNRVAVITGAAKGIGKAMVQQFAGKGALIYGIDVDDVEGEKLQEEMGDSFCYLHADISNESDIENVLKVIITKHDHIDILINNAAVQTQAPFAETTTEDFRKVINIDLIGTFICCKVFTEHMINGSVVLNMLSVHSSVPRKNTYAYDAAKAGIEMLTKEMALDLADRGIRVLGLSYGAVYTPMNARMIVHPELAQIAVSKVPLHWIAQAEEIAACALAVVEHFSDYSTGSIFTVDGGRSLTGC